MENCFSCSSYQYCLTCSFGYFYDSELLKCLKCPEFENEICPQCLSNLQWNLTDYCIFNEKKRTFFKDEDNQIKICQSYCKNCKNINGCNECESSHFISFISSDVQICEKCPSFSKKCGFFEKISGVLYNPQKHNVKNKEDFQVYFTFIMLDCIDTYFLDSDYICKKSLDNLDNCIQAFFCDYFGKKLTDKSYLIKFFNDKTAFDSILIEAKMRIKCLLCKNTFLPAINLETCEKCYDNCEKCYFFYLNGAEIKNFTEIQNSDNFNNDNEIISKGWKITKKCEKCFATFIEVENQCGKCSETLKIEGCLNCKLSVEKLKCTECKESYYLDENNNCLKCPENCKNCFLYLQKSTLMAVKSVVCNECFTKNNFIAVNSQVDYKCYYYNIELKEIEGKEIPKNFANSHKIEINDNSSICREFLYNTTNKTAGYLKCNRCKNNKYPGFNSICVDKYEYVFYNSNLYNLTYQILDFNNIDTLIEIKAFLNMIYFYKIYSDPEILCNEFDFGTLKSLSTVQGIIFKCDQCPKNCLKCIEGGYNDLKCKECNTIKKFSNTTINIYSFIYQLILFSKNFGSMNEYDISNLILSEPARQFLIDFETVIPEEYKQTDINSFYYLQYNNLFMNYILTNNNCIECRFGCNLCSTTNKDSSLSNNNFREFTCGKCSFDKPNSNYIRDQNRKTCKFCPIKWGNCNSILNYTFIIQCDENSDNFKIKNKIIFASIKQLETMITYIIKVDSKSVLYEFDLKEIHLKILFPIKTNCEIENKDVNWENLFNLKKQFDWIEVYKIKIGSYYVNKENQEYEEIIDDNKRANLNLKFNTNSFIFNNLTLLVINNINFIFKGNSNKDCFIKFIYIDQFIIKNSDFTSLYQSLSLSMKFNSIPKALFNNIQFIKIKISLSEHFLEFIDVFHVEINSCKFFNSSFISNNQNFWIIHIEHSYKNTELFLITDLILDNNILKANFIEIKNVNDKSYYLKNFKIITNEFDMSSFLFFTIASNDNKNLQLYDFYFFNNTLKNKYENLGLLIFFKITSGLYENFLFEKNNFYKIQIFDSSIISQIGTVLSLKNFYLRDNIFNISKNINTNYIFYFIKMPIEIDEIYFIDNKIIKELEESIVCFYIMGSLIEKTNLNKIVFINSIIDFFYISQIQYLQIFNVFIDNNLMVIEKKRGVLPFKLENIEKSIEINNVTVKSLISSYCIFYITISLSYSSLNEGDIKIESLNIIDVILMQSIISPVSSIYIKTLSSDRPIHLTNINMIYIQKETIALESSSCLTIDNIMNSLRITNSSFFDNYPIFMLITCLDFEFNYVRMANNVNKIKNENFPAFIIITLPEKSEESFLQNSDFFNVSQLVGLEINCGSLTCQIKIINCVFENYNSSNEGAIFYINLEDRSVNIFILTNIRVSNISSVESGGLFYFQGEANLVIDMKIIEIMNISCTKGSLIFAQNMINFDLNISFLKLNNKKLFNFKTGAIIEISSKILKFFLHNSIISFLFGDTNFAVFNSDKGIYFFYDSKFLNNMIGDPGILNFLTGSTAIFKNCDFIENYNDENINSASLTQEQKSDFWKFLEDVSLRSIIYGSKINITVFNSNFINNYCKRCLGGVFFLTSINYIFLNESFFYSNLGLIGGAMHLRWSQRTVIQSIISFSSFTKNNGQYFGGALYLVNANLLINNCFFLSNSAFLTKFSKNLQYFSEKGGAIYMESNLDEIPKIYLKNLVFSENFAKIGAAIFIKDYYYFFSNSFIKYNMNRALYFGNDCYSKPSYIKIMFIDGDFSALNAFPYKDLELKIKDFKSGGRINSLIIKLYDENDKEIFELEESIIVGITMKENLTENNPNVTNKFSISDNIKQEFDKFAIINITDLTLHGTFNNTYMITINVTIMKNIGELNCGKSSNLIFYVTFRNCNPGEIVNDFGGKIECSDCPIGKYSLTQNSLECKYCDIYSMSYCYKNFIFIRQGFWRKDNQTDRIQECVETKEYCLGDGQPPKNLEIFNNYSLKNFNCDEGNIGALCGSCDYYGRIWKDRYYRASQYKCEKCLKPKYIIIFAIFMVFFNIFMMWISVHGVTELLQLERLKIMKKSLAFLSMTNKGKKGSIYLKMIVNYFQIISVITSLKFTALNNLKTFINVIGNPTETLLYSTDCLFTTITIDPPLIYLKSFFAFVAPFLYIILFFIFYYIFCLLKLIKFPSYKIVVTASLFIVLYSQPNILSMLLGLIGCTTIAFEDYIKIDTAYPCYDFQHSLFVFLFALPAALVWLILIPGIIFYLLFRKRNDLKKTGTQIELGFLYGEFKEKYYYWELIKLLEKNMIISFLSFFDSSTNIKGMIVLTIIFIYFLLIIKHSPYISKEVEKFDIANCFVCYFTIFFALFCYDNTFPEFLIISYIVICLSNGIYIFTVFKYYFRAYNLHLITFLKSKLINKFPIFKKFIKINRQKNTIELWKKLKFTILNHIKKRKNSKNAGSYYEKRLTRRSTVNTDVVRKLLKDDEKYIKKKEIIIEME